MSGGIEHNGVEHAAGVQRAGDGHGGHVCVASGPGWSLFWPRAEWDGLRPAARRKVIRNARRRYANEAAEDDQLDPFDQLVDQEPPAWRDWRGQ